MASFYTSLNAFFSTRITKEVAIALEERDADIQKTHSHLVAGLLGVMVKQGNTFKIKALLKRTGEKNLISEIGGFDEDLVYPHQHIGEEFIHLLLKGDESRFIDAVKEESNISLTSIDHLISIVGFHFAAFFGKKVVKDEMSLSRIINDIKDDQETYTTHITTEVIKRYRLHKVFTTLQPEVPSRIISFFTPSSSEISNGKVSWFARLFMSLSFFIMIGSTSCNSNHTNAGDKERMEYLSDSIGPIEETWEMTQIELPNGKRITAYENGVEEKMVLFLTSKEYQEATEADLKDKWFEFDNIDFEFGSTTDLKEASENQLNNIIAILRAYEDAKVTVAAFTDKGNKESAYTQVSKERARTVVKLLEKRGAGTQLIIIDEDNEPNIEYSTNAPRSEVAKDRGIAIRFIK